VNQIADDDFAGAFRFGFGTELDEVC